MGAQQSLFNEHQADSDGYDGGHQFAPYSLNNKIQHCAIAHQMSK